MSQPKIKAELWKAWRLATAPARFLPNFFVPGAPKCGTSSLYDCLRQHPQFATSKRKEPTNFIHYPTSALRSRMNFPFRIEQLWRGPLVAGEASVEYFFHPDVPANVHRVVPEARLIFMMRDPIRRAWSDFQMFRRDGSERGSFDERIREALRWLQTPADWPLVEASLRQSHNPVRYVYAGAYWPNLQRWIEVFPVARCLFLFSEDFFDDAQAVMDRVFEFLELAPCQLKELPHAREGGYREWMNQETEKLLRDYYVPLNQQLAAFLGRNLPWT